MRDTMSTLESQPVQSQANDMTEAVETIRGKKVRFAYASGSRPLTGYTIKRGIGVGGFGEVYFAISDAGKEVALKHIKRNLDIELRGVRQCLNLKHINLIALWDICTTESGESWVVMEYVPGDSLRDACERHPNGMPANEVQRWFRSTAAGVNYLHNNGIVHRDLKPGNIFYDADEDLVKIGDYGLSKFISCSRRSGQTESVGTFHYMAPEIGKGVYGKEIDIYALGVMLYEMLSGKLPFDGETSQEIIMKHLTADPNLDPIPAAFRSVIFRALAKDPDERYHTIEELMADFPPGNGQANGNYTSVPAIGSANKSNRLVQRPVTSSDASPPLAFMQSTGNPAIDNDTIYIGEDPGIVFCDSPQVVDAEVVPHGFIMPSGDKPLGVIANEPIARAVTNTYHSLVDQWNRTKLGTGAKTGILVIAGIVLLANSAYLLPLGLVFGLFYLPYLAIRAWTVAPKTRVAKPIRLSRRQFDTHLRQTLMSRSAGQRLGDLTGSLLTSAVVCIVFGLLTGTYYAQQSTVSAWSYGAWVTLTATAACWSILICSKQWETSTGENLVRRFWMLVVGLLVALFSFGVSQAIEMDLSKLAVESDSNLFGSDFQKKLFDADGQPTLPLFLMFFGSVFAVLRWWRQSDPTRKTRLSIWSVCLSWFAAILLAEALDFPQVAACLAVVSAAVAIQLSAPWINQTERKQIRLAASGRV